MSKDAANSVEVDLPVYIIFLIDKFNINIFKTDHGVLGFWGFGVLGLGFRV